MLKGTKAYVQTKFTTAGQGDVLILLYDGALKFLTQAKEKMLEKDVAAKGNLISKTLDIINELDCALNVEAGGELAQNLHQLYLICSTRLLQANLRMDPALLDSVSEILSGLKSAYVQIMNTPEAQAASTQIAAKMSPTGAQVQRSAHIPQATTSSGIGRAQAQNAYGAAQKDFKDPEAAPMAANLATSAPATATMPAMAANLATSAPVTATMPAMAAPMAATTATSPATPPIAAPAPVTSPPPPPINLAARRLAASNRYGQVAQVSGA